MDLLKFELFTPCTTFKAPLSLKGIETYPLPPPSTIIGLLYTALGIKWEGEKFRLSIQGDFECIFRDYMRMRKYNRKDKELSPLPLEVPRLYNFRAVIHVSAEDKGLLEDFLKGLQGPKTYLFLGGGEYPVLVKSPRMVKAKREYVEEERLKRSAFLSDEDRKKLFVDEGGIQFRVTTFCVVENGVRDCEWIDVFYVSKGQIFEDGEVLKDEEGDQVWLLSM